jgi:hypothetical protein
MTNDGMLEGQCLCGAVRVRAVIDEAVLHACHCGMCRAWTSGMFMSVSTRPESQQVEGPVRVFRSSDWAQRGFCSTCGSPLWYETTADGHRNLAAGLFENAGGAHLAMEFNVDRKPEGYALAGDHPRLSEAETLALFAGETP